MRRALLAEILSARAAREAFVLATRLPDGAQRLLTAPSADAIGQAAASVLARDVAETVELEGERWLLAPHNPPLRLYIVGAVHIAQALVPLARTLDFAVTVIDPRRGWGTPERFPGVPLHAEWPQEALPRLGLDRRTAIVVLSHDPKIDEPALIQALRSDAFYLGALGSRKTQAARRQRLASQGFGEADLARIHGPVGLAIGARSPAEVALSIAAEIVQIRRLGAAAPASS